MNTDKQRYEFVLSVWIGVPRWLYPLFPQPRRALRGPSPHPLDDPFHVVLSLLNIRNSARPVHTLRRRRSSLRQGGAGEQNPENTRHMDLSAKTPSGSRGPPPASTAISGCRRRSRTKMLAAGSKSRARPSASEREGKRVSPNAAMAPLIPRIITVPRLNAAIPTARPPPRTGAWAAVHHAVSVRHASSVSVFTRCADSE